MQTSSAPFTRVLGRSGLEVGALGLGCWAIGGPWDFNGAPAGWSVVDDDESVRAVRRALDLGVTLFDTAACYGAGHSERVLGRALAGRRQDVVIVSKFGFDVDEANRSAVLYAEREEDTDLAAHLEADLAASLRRLGTDYLDICLIHPGALRLDRALEARDVLERLVAAGTIRSYGWSTDLPDVVRTFAEAPNCGVGEQALSVLDGNGELVALCEELNLGNLVRAPLGMGLLSGRYTARSTFPADDVRHYVTWHPGFRDGRPTTEWLDRIAAVRDVLTAGGRTLAQGALAWIWARSPLTVPIPGFRTVAQVEENCGATAAGPLSVEQVREIDDLLTTRA